MCKNKIWACPQYSVRFIFTASSQQYFSLTQNQHQPASSIFLSQKISTSHQHQPAEHSLKRSGNSSPALMLSPRLNFLHIMNFFRYSEVSIPAKPHITHDTNTIECGSVGLWLVPHGKGHGWQRSDANGYLTVYTITECEPCHVLYFIGKHTLVLSCSKEPRTNKTK